MSYLNIIDITFCALVMAGLSQKRHGLILPALVYIPIIGFIGLLGLIGSIVGLTAANIAINRAQAEAHHDNDNYYGYNYNYEHGYYYNYNTTVNAVDTAQDWVTGLCTFFIVVLSIALIDWLLGWIAFYKAYQYLKVAYPSLPPQQFPLQPQQGQQNININTGQNVSTQPMQGYVPQYAPQQGYVPQQGFPSQQGFPPTQGFLPQQAFPPPKGFPPQQGFPPPQQGSSSQLHPYYEAIEAPPPYRF